jgi:hypothetical protein
VRPLLRHVDATDDGVHCMHDPPPVAPRPSSTSTPRGLPTVLSFSKLEIDESFTHSGSPVPEPEPEMGLEVTVQEREEEAEDNSAIQNVVVSWAAVRTEMSAAITGTATAPLPIAAEAPPVSAFELLDLQVEEEAWERKAAREQQQETAAAAQAATPPTLASVEAAMARAKKATGGANHDDHYTLTSPEPEPNRHIPPTPTPYAAVAGEDATATATASMAPDSKAKATPGKLTKRGSLTPLLSKKPTVDWDSVRKRNLSVTGGSGGKQSGSTSASSDAKTAPISTAAPNSSNSSNSFIAAPNALKRRPSLLMGQTVDAAALQMFRRPSLMPGEKAESDSDDEADGDMGSESEQPAEGRARNVTVDVDSDDSDDEHTHASKPGSAVVAPARTLVSHDTIGAIDGDILQYDSDDEQFFSTTNLPPPVLTSAGRIPAKRASAPAMAPAPIVAHQGFKATKDKSKAKSNDGKLSGSNEGSASVLVPRSAMSASMMNIAQQPTGPTVAVGDRVTLPDGSGRQFIVPNKHVNKVMQDVVAYNSHYNIAYASNLLPKLRVYYNNPTAVGAAGSGMIALDAAAVRKLLTLLGGSKLTQQTTMFQVSEFVSYLQQTKVSSFHSTPGDDDNDDSGSAGVALCDIEGMLEYYFLHLQTMGYPPHPRLSSSSSAAPSATSTANSAAPAATVLTAKQLQTQKVASAAKRLFG